MNNSHTAVRRLQNTHRHDGAELARLAAQAALSAGILALHAAWALLFKRRVAAPAPAESPAHSPVFEPVGSPGRMRTRQSTSGGGNHSH